MIVCKVKKGCRGVTYHFSIIHVFFLTRLLMKTSYYNADVDGLAGFWFFIKIQPGIATQVSDIFLF